MTVVHSTIVLKTVAWFFDEHDTVAVDDEVVRVEDGAV